MQDNNNTQQFKQVTEQVEPVEIKTPDFDGIQEGIQKTQKDIEENRANFEQEMAAYKAKIEALEAERFQSQLALEGIEYAGEFLNKLTAVESNDDKITILVDFINEVKKQNSYIPQEVAKQDAYTQAQAKGDAQGMIVNKFSKFFGK